MKKTLLLAFYVSIVSIFSSIPSISSAVEVYWGDGWSYWFRPAALPTLENAAPIPGRYCKVYVDRRVRATGTWERGYGKVYVDRRVIAAIDGDVSNCSLAVMTAGSVLDIGIGI